MKTRSIQQQIADAATGGVRLMMPSWEIAVLARAIAVLRRIAENDCTNAQREAADMIREIDEQRSPL